jgi:hypothetical protein
MRRLSMSLRSDDDEPSYDDPTQEELEEQAVEARLEAYHAECWESVFGEVIEDLREDIFTEEDPLPRRVRGRRRA